ncbi:flavodoxin-dependent (E)-4-hydroxy-3-methylbut-2-enyl-diphosphate synthase [Limisalsivibrio acetivorans]|uniref:flavodoxin-dependent (E)-4-hydroxy-3-methylbut-2-enyl-diphosphate synthase n=1 Tax=Limisalsivibrio acetivorans TaxID=1304888 RepID=UPI0003B3F2E6|nr:flavodoxin-dependent (E)-4-hydroxy-3-methylbut-2-enyl-diphosphate synthase [Limisalsivibrio acetivorans]
MYKREETKQINVGGVAVGGGAPVSIQSMTNTDTRDAEATLKQIHALEDAGCEIIRVAVPDMEAAGRIRTIRDNIAIPLIADIHFDHKLALTSVENGADCIRINPGNIGSEEKVVRVLDACRANGSSIRIGVNSGSVEKELVKQYGVCAESLVISASRHVELFEKHGFTDFKVSLKGSNVPLSIEAYRQFAEQYPYPLHIGITEAGTLFSGTVKSSAGIGAILSLGIGDTLRVSLTGDPVQEVRVGWEILKSMGLRRRGPEVISCPTCGRAEIDLITLAENVQESLKEFRDYFTVAVMGCPVNGPGEAKEADYGIAGGKGQGLLFKKGNIISKVPEGRLLESLTDMLKAEGLS